MQYKNSLNLMRSYTPKSLEKSLKFIDNDASILINRDAGNMDSVKSIILTTDLSDYSYKVFLQLLKICKEKNYVINFLYVNTTSKPKLFKEDFKAELSRFTNICPPKNCGIIWETPSNKIAEGIEEVVDNFSGELIVVACQNNCILELNKSYLQNFVFLDKTLTAPAV